MDGDTTRDRIMEAARLTVQDLGYSGLSFRDLAKTVGIKSASIHYYFPTKEALGKAIAGRYIDRYERYFEDLQKDTTGCTTLMRLYTDVFRDTLLNNNRLCLAGMLAAEHNNLPPEVRAEVVRWGEMNERWIARVLTSGRMMTRRTSAGGRNPSSRRCRCPNDRARPRRRHLLRRCRRGLPGERSHPVIEVTHFMTEPYEGPAWL